MVLLYPNSQQKVKHKMLCPTGTLKMTTKLMRMSAPICNSNSTPNVGMSSNKNVACVTGKTLKAFSLDATCGE